MNGDPEEEDERRHPHEGTQEGTQEGWHEKTEILGRDAGNGAE